MSVVNKTNEERWVNALRLNDGTQNPSVNKQFRITLTSAQILALFTTPISLIPAGGAGTYISVDEIMAYLTFNSIAYAGANAVELRYTNGAGAKVTGDLASAFLNSGASAAAKAIAAAVTPVANAAVVAAVPVANPTAGNSTLTIEGSYRIVTLP